MCLVAIAKIFRLGYFIGRWVYWARQNFCMYVRSGMLYSKYIQRMNLNNPEIPTTNVIAFYETLNLRNEKVYQAVVQLLFLYDAFFSFSIHLNIS
jgi:hypothetical protein